MEIARFQYWPGQLKSLLRDIEAANSLELPFSVTTAKEGDHTRYTLVVGLWDSEDPEDPA